MSAQEAQGRHDAGAMRRSQRRGRERGCWVYIAADQLRKSGLSPEDPPPLYRVWSGERGRHIVTLYPETLAIADAFTPPDPFSRKGLRRCGTATRS